MKKRTIEDFFQNAVGKKLKCESESNEKNERQNSIETPTSSLSVPKNLTPIFDSVHKNNQEAHGETTTAEMYKGLKMDVEWLMKSFPTVFTKVKLGRRQGLKCNICFNQITEAQKHSKNGKVSMAEGVRSDGKKELQRIIDHLESSAHLAALKVEKAEKLWLSQSDNHPWVHVLKKYECELVSRLIELAIDVHNDSQVMTLSANSWPSRSLSKMHADQQISMYQENGLGTSFTPFNPPASALHHRNPTIYREMLDIVSEVVMKDTLKDLENAVCFSLQVDGSVDKYSVDNKFVTARFLGKDKELKNIFLGETHSDLRGADGLLDSVVSLFKNLKIENVLKEKLTGLTTDGESANTGKNGGLWVKLKDYLKRGLLCIWCVAHRSDLVLSDLESSVMEVQHWKINMKAVSSFYRASGVRTDELKAKCKELKAEFYSFPAFFDVRFVEHLNHLAKTVWKNLPGMRLHWNSVLSSEKSERKEKAAAEGFLKVWGENGDQVYFTALMLDLFDIIEKLQKDCQKSLITLCDIETSKKAAIDSVALMEKMPFPGGVEEILKRSASQSEENKNKGRKKKNLFVTTSRSREAVRNEIVLSVKEFLGQRLDLDQENIIKNLKIFLKSKTAKSMIEESREVVEQLFGTGAVKSFSQEVVDLFAGDKLPAPSALTDLTGVLYHYLKISERGTIFSKLVETYISLTPHSSGPERAVSCHTALKGPKQSSYSREAINSRMYIALNSPGTAHFDPRPAVALFLQKKERRLRLPEPELYKQDFFVKTFFSEGKRI